MLNKKDLISLREVKESDKSFILATFLRGLYYGDSWFKDVPKGIFMENYHKIVTNLISHPQVVIKVACLKDDEDVILGYSVYRRSTNPVVLDYVFVKASWRNIGIARSLVPEGISMVTHLTKVGKNILRVKLPEVKFNPFLL